MTDSHRLHAIAIADVLAAEGIDADEAQAAGDLTWHLAASLARVPSPDLMTCAAALTILRQRAEHQDPTASFAGSDQ